MRSTFVAASCGITSLPDLSRRAVVQPAPPSTEWEEDQIRLDHRAHPDRRDLLHQALPDHPEEAGRRDRPEDHQDHRQSVRQGRQAGAWAASRFGRQSEQPRSQSNSSVRRRAQLPCHLCRPSGRNPGYPVANSLWAAPGHDSGCRISPTWAGCLWCKSTRWPWRLAGACSGRPCSGPACRRPARPRPPSGGRR